MISLQIIAIGIALLCIWNLNRHRMKYRKLWHDTANQLIAEREGNTGGVMLQLQMAKKSAKHWNEMMHKAQDELHEVRRKEANGRRQLTQALATIDGLLHGDRQCANGHRFYSPAIPNKIESTTTEPSESIYDVKCPHCGAGQTESMSAEEVLAELDEENCHL